MKPGVHITAKTAPTTHLGAWPDGMSVRGAWICCTYCSEMRICVASAEEWVVRQCLNHLILHYVYHDVISLEELGSLREVRGGATGRKVFQPSADTYTPYGGSRDSGGGSRDSGGGSQANVVNTSPTTLPGNVSTPRP